MLAPRPCSVFLFLLVIIVISCIFMTMSRPPFMASAVSTYSGVRYSIKNYFREPFAIRDVLLHGVKFHDPQSRLFVMYVPTSEHYLKEVAGFMESWRYVFEIPDLEDEPKDLILKYIDKLNTKYIYDTLDVPINDVLIVASPDIRPSQLPRICHQLTSPYPHEQLKLEERIASKHSRCFYIFLSLDMTEDNQLWSTHSAIHSVSMMAEPIIQNIMIKYDLALRTDLDCFLLPVIRSRSLTPWGNENNGFDLFVGRSGYATTKVIGTLHEYRDILHLDGNLESPIGSTWYGRPADLINLATLTVNVGRYLFQHDPVFLRGPGFWPGWYKGVGLLYSGDIAVNHRIEAGNIKIQSNLLDYVSTSRNYIYSNAVHVHCWHTEHLYSKHRMIKGLYSTETLDTFKGQRSEIRYAAASFAFIGTWRYLQEEKKTQPSYQRQLLKRAILGMDEGAVVCPVTHPYPVNTEFDDSWFCCRYQPLTYTSPSESTLFLICHQQYIYDESALNRYLKPPFLIALYPHKESDVGKGDYVQCPSKKCVSPEYVNPIRGIVNSLMDE